MGKALGAGHAGGFDTGSWMTVRCAEYLLLWSTVSGDEGGGRRPRVDATGRAPRDVPAPHTSPDLSIPHSLHYVGKGINGVPGPFRQCLKPIERMNSAQARGSSRVLGTVGSVWGCGCHGRATARSQPENNLHSPVVTVGRLLSAIVGLGRPAPLVLVDCCPPILAPVRRRGCRPCPLRDTWSTDGTTFDCVASWLHQPKFSQPSKQKQRLAWELSTKAVLRFD